MSRDGVVRDAVRYTAALAGLFLVWLLLARLIGTHQVPTLDDLDHRVAAWAVQTRAERPGLTPVFLALTRLGDTAIALPLTVLIGLGLYVLRRRGVAGLGRGDALFWVGVVAGSRLLVDVLKRVIARDRPPLEFRLVEETSSSFPSGHATSSAAFLAGLAILGARMARSRAAPRWVVPAWSGLCLGLAALIGASRVWLGVHYLSDVASGFALGVAWAVAAGWIRFGGRTSDAGATGPGAA